MNRNGAFEQIVVTASNEAQAAGYRSELTANTPTSQSRFYSFSFDTRGIAIED
jgi:hypothetical protein